MTALDLTKLAEGLRRADDFCHGSDEYVPEGTANPVAAESWSALPTVPF